MSADTVRVNRIREVLWPRGDDQYLFTILDGARNRKIYSKLLNSYAESACLYLGDLNPDLESAAPHLVRLEYDDTLTLDILKNGWGDSWGIFFRAQDSFDRIRRHFRRFLRVKDESGRNLVFRYYDPRVLRTYLPTCQPRELDYVFGDSVKSFWMEHSDPGKIIESTRDRAALKTKVMEV